MSVNHGNDLEISIFWHSRLLLAPGNRTEKSFPNTVLFGNIISVVVGLTFYSGLSSFKL